MIRKRLEMTFKNANDGRANISVDEPREDLTPEEIKDVMDEIIEKEIFYSGGGELVDIIGARIVRTEIEDIGF
ncbi:MAG TPA: DUF2922 domain-containing protein [Tissierellales bacterium]|nr:DUF2922 domain-containing protein [Tissierellales bacterium]